MQSKFIKWCPSGKNEIIYIHSLAPCWTRGGRSCSRSYTCLASQIVSEASDLQIRRLLRSQAGLGDIAAQRTGLMSTTVLLLQTFSSHSDNLTCITKCSLSTPRKDLQEKKKSNLIFYILKILFEKYNTQQRIMSSPTALSQRKLYGKCNCDIWLG